MSFDLQIAALALGVLLVGAAIGWRWMRVHRVRGGIRAALADPEPAVRVDAVRRAVEFGLTSTAPMLLRVVRAETDATVLATVVEAVAGHQWEPASTAAIVELRLWAKAYSDARPDLQRPAAGPPLLPGISGTVMPPSLNPLREREFRRRLTTDVHDADPDTAAGPFPTDDDPLAPVRVLVTGAGGAAGVAVIRDLHRSGHVVVAVDADPDAVGLRLADHAHAVPRYDDPTYLAALIRVATVFDAQALICTVTEELQVLGGASGYLEEAGLRALLPSLDTVRTCRDKWLFAQAMGEAGLPIPATALGGADDVPGPWVVKPRFGRGSRDVHLVQTKEQLAGALALVPDPIVQARASGREFTADALVHPAGTVAGVVARWRLATKGGISTLGETFDDELVTETTGLALKALGHVGPANVQGFVDDDGALSVVEVNPRFSGGLPLSLFAGADLVGEYLRAVMGRAVRPERLVARPGVTMYRYFDEVYQG